jgi:hypothetical protein
VTLTQSTVSGNSTGYGSQGGGIFSSGAVTLTQSTVSGNSTARNFGSGGGIWAAGAVTLTQSTVSGNSTDGGNADGGGIYAFGSVTLTQSTVSGNSTTGGGDGGGIYAFGSVTLTQSTVSGNSTARNFDSGGGIYAGGAVTLTQSTVSGNSTAGFGASGGGIWALGAVTLTQSTVTDNHALYSNSTGGGVFQFNTGSNHPFSISGSIVAGNTAGGGGADLVPDPTSMLSVNYSLIGVAAAGMTGIGNITGLDPLLGPLANNGGPTETHALLAGSPAIDMGDPNFDPADPDGDPLTDDAMPYDQRGVGFARVAGGRIDIGAFEVQSVALAGDGNGDGWVDGLDYLLWASNYDTHPGPDGDISDADYNDDGWVDGLDYLLWAANYGSHAAMAASHTASAEDELAAVDAALEMDYSAAATVDNDPSIADWQLSKAFDVLLKHVGAKRTARRL